MEFDHTDPFSDPSEWDEEGTFERMKLLNNNDYNLNSPLIPDDLDELSRFLKTGQLGSRFQKKKGWKELRELLAASELGVSDWGGSMRCHQLWAKVCLQLRNPSEMGKRLITYVNKSASIVGEVERSFFRGLMKVDIPSTRKMMSGQTMNWLDIFLDCHIMALWINAADDVEQSVLASRFHFRPWGNTSMMVWDSYVYGSVLLSGSLVLVTSDRTIIDRNFLLMMKDAAIARFATIVSMLDRTDNVGGPRNENYMNDVYRMGDTIIRDFGNDGYTQLKLIEPICSNRLAELAKLHRPLIPDFPAFRSHVESSVKECNSLALLTLKAKIDLTEDVDQVLIVYSSFRHWGHPFVDYPDGLTKLHAQVTKTKDIDKDYANTLASDMAYIVLKTQFDKKRKWYVDHTKMSPQDPMTDHIANCTWPTPAQISAYGDKWHELPLTTCFEIPDMIDPSIIYSDKSHSMNRSEVLYHISTNPYNPIPSRKVLTTMLNSKATDWKTFLKEVDEKGLSKEDLVIGLKPKERELKIAGRFFSLMSWRLREYFVITEYLIKLHFVPLFKGLTMADDMTEVVKKMLDSAYGQGLDDYSSVCIANHIDYEKWNNHQRLESNGPVFKVMGQFLGYPNLLYRTHEFFQQSLIYFNMRPDQMEVVGNSARPKGTILACWEGQDGGLEGLRQKGWSILNLLVIRRESRIRNTSVKILAQGDNQVICTQYKLPPVRGDTETKAALLGMTENNGAIMRAIEAGTNKLGLLINQDETVQSADYLIYGKVPIFRGNIRGLETKRWSRITCVTNDQLPTFANVLSSVSTNALTVSHFGTSIVDPIRNYLFFGILAKEILDMHNPALRGPIENFITHPQFNRRRPGYVAACLYLDPSLGGVSGLSLTRFLIRGFPDPVTEGLSFWKIVHQNCQSPWLKGLSLEAGHPRVTRSLGNDVSRLMEDPTSLNIPKGISAMTIMKEEVKKGLYRGADSIQNVQVRSAVQYSRDEEEKMSKFLSSVRPLFPRFLSEFKSATFLGMTDSLISLFQNSRTIRNFFSAGFKRELDNKIIRGEMSTLTQISGYGKGHLRGQLWTCSAEQADRLRLVSWGSPIIGTTVPHPAEMIQSGEKSSLGCRGCLGSSPDCYLTVSVPRGISQFKNRRGPFKAYLGSKTSESTSILQPWERHTAIPLIKRAAKLRNAISWFIEPDSNLAKSILGNLTSQTGEDWSGSIPGFRRTGSALHRFSCSRVSAGGYAAQSPAKLTWMVATTDTMSTLGNDNYDFMFQSLLIYAQCITGEMHKESDGQGVYHFHLSCKNCVRVIEEPHLESDWVYQFIDRSEELARWRGRDEEWGKERTVATIPTGDWELSSKRKQSFHVGRAQGFVFGDIHSLKSHQSDDVSLFPLTIQRRLIPDAFFQGLLDGLMRAAGLDLLHRRSMQKMIHADSAVHGTVFYLIGLMSECTGLRNLVRDGPLRHELDTIPHRIPPSYPLSDRDMGISIRNYLWSLYRDLMMNSNYRPIDSRLFVFADMMCPSVLGPFIVSSAVLKIWFTQDRTQQAKTTLRGVAHAISAFRDPAENIPDCTQWIKNVYSVDSEIRHACKFEIKTVQEDERRLTWGQEVVGECVSAVVPFLPYPTTQLTLERMASRVQDPTISGLRVAQIATGSHYKIRTIIKRERIQYRDFIAAGDGSGGITSALLRIQRQGRGIFNSLLDYSQATLKGSAPAPPSAVYALGTKASRCVNLKTCWKYPSDLSLDDTWEYFKGIKSTGSLNIDLIVMDMEVRDSEMARQIVSRVKQHLWDLLEPNGVLIFKTYLTTLATEPHNILNLVGAEFEKVMLMQTSFSSSQTSEVYAVMCGARLKSNMPLYTDWAGLDICVHKFCCWASREKEFSRARQILELDTTMGVPPELIPELSHELTVLLTIVGLETGVAASWSEHLTWRTCDINDVLATIILASNSVVRVTSYSTTRPSPPSDTSVSNLGSFITGSLLWLGVSLDKRDLHAYGLGFIEHLFPFYWSVSQKPKGWACKWSLTEGMINKGVRLDSSMANIGQWIRVWRRTNWREDIGFHPTLFNQMLVPRNVKLNFWRSWRYTGLRDILELKAIQVNRFVFDVETCKEEETAWRD
ncbi:L protein [Wuhan redfin culter dimarhabdovirus]|uniref:Replicase n=1 Tax=Wuhan redfin culter dimarhabdovirus TaxID=3071315 RepID=A0AAD0MPF5_9RHAB|nr:L protein [Wuhan redfin culter dimarhabodovirus]AVM87289.1 L protein [Wuhan redfin culter dimarhabodovirus]